MGKSGRHRQAKAAPQEEKKESRPAGIKVDGKAVTVLASVVFWILAAFFFIAGNHLGGGLMAACGVGVVFVGKALLIKPTS